MYIITLLQPTSVTQSFFHQHDPADQLRMELLLCNIHVRDWVTVPSPSLAQEFQTICQPNYDKLFPRLLSKVEDLPV